MIHRIFAEALKEHDNNMEAISEFNKLLRMHGYTMARIYSVPDDEIMRTENHDQYICPNYKPVKTNYTKEELGQILDVKIRETEEKLQSSKRYTEPIMFQQGRLEALEELKGELNV